MTAPVRGRNIWRHPWGVEKLGQEKFFFIINHQKTCHLSKVTYAQERLRRGRTIDKRKGRKVTQWKNTMEGNGRKETAKPVQSLHTRLYVVCVRNSCMLLAPSLLFLQHCNRLHLSLFFFTEMYSIPQWQLPSLPFLTFFYCIYKPSNFPC